MEKKQIMKIGNGNGQTGIRIGPERAPGRLLAVVLIPWRPWKRGFQNAWTKRRGKIYLTSNRISIC
jgi:hypothetical protein